MKFFQTSFLFLVGALASTFSVNSFAEDLALKKVFVPASGFDNNDMVQVVAQVSLPNSCYRLDQASVEVKREEKQILLKQKAIQLNTGPCSDLANLPEEFRNQVILMNEIHVGQLDAGTYKVLYQSEKGPADVEFVVGEVPATAGIDTLRYPTISNIVVNEMAFRSKDKKFKVAIYGTLNSSCISVDDKVGVAKLNDVYVVLFQTTRFGDVCLPLSTPFTREFELELPQDLGSYLIHVRSSHGRSVNKIFTVAE